MLQIISSGVLGLLVGLLAHRYAMRRERHKELARFLDRYFACFHAVDNAYGAAVEARSEKELEECLQDYTDALTQAYTAYQALTSRADHRFLLFAKATLLCAAALYEPLADKQRPRDHEHIKQRALDFEYFRRKTVKDSRRHLAGEWRVRFTLRALREEPTPEDIRLDRVVRRTTRPGRAPHW